MDRGAQEAMRDQMGFDLDQAGESRVLREGGEGTRGAGGAGADGRGERGVGATIRFTVPVNQEGKKFAEFTLPLSLDLEAPSADKPWRQSLEK